MLSGKVTQVLPALRRLEALEGLALVQVQTQNTLLTAADSLGAAPGQQVVLSQGPAARAAFGTNCPADAVVLCVLGE